MAANLIWLRADDNGDTRLERYPVSVSSPELRSTDGAFALHRQDIPATEVQVVELPKQGPREVFHPAPRRQFVVVLQGELEMSTTDGSEYRFRAGDWLLADDVGSKGHRVADIGEENLVTIQMALPDDWSWPVAQSDGGGTR